MAYSGQTTHYGLPKYVSTDKPSWLDTNDAFDTIDAAIYAAATAVDPSTITTMQNDITALQSGKQDVLTFDAAPASGSVNPVTSGGVYTAVNNVSIALGVTDLKVSALEGAMGNTDISAIGDGTVTGAISSLAQSGGDSVSISFTSTDTWGAALTQLTSAADLTKIKATSKILVSVPGEDSAFAFTRKDGSGNYNFNYATGGSSSINVNGITIGANKVFYAITHLLSGTDSYTDNSPNATTVAGTITLYY